MINLNSIEIEGFGSIIKPIKYKIKNIGLNKIEGPNGVGKTTITNALAWVGWGQLVKPRKSSISPWPHIIDENYHGTRVLLKFDDGKAKYKIIRCQEYTGKILDKKGGNRLIILKNGVELKEPGLRDKKDYQKWIINKLGYSFELFKSTVLFTQELDNLMKEDGPTRKKIFDEAFETTFVNNAKKRAEEQLLTQVTEKEALDTKIALNFGKIQGLRQSIQITKDNLKDFEALKQRRVNDVRKIIIELKGNKSKLDKELHEKKPLWDKYPKLQNKLDEYKKTSDKEFRLEMALNGEEELLEELKIKNKSLIESYTKVELNCSKCGKPLDKQSISKIKEQIQKDIKICKVEIKKCEAGLPKLKENYKEAKKALIKLDKVKREISDINIGRKDFVYFNRKEFIKRIKEEKAKFTKIRDEKPLPNKLLELARDLKEVRAINSTLRNEKKNLNKLIKVNKWLIKDPLSNSGLKAFIFDSMLGRVNNYLKGYTNIIGFGIKVIIDMNSANKDIRIVIERGGDELPYEDLSKGQKQLTNVALAFSLSDAVQSLKPINCIFLDELFESLSVENVEKVGNIIINKAKTKAVHLITHQSSFSPQNCNVTFLQLNSKKQTELF